MQMLYNAAGLDFRKMFVYHMFTPDSSTEHLQIIFCCTSRAFLQNITVGLSEKPLHENTKSFWPHLVVSISSILRYESNFCAMLGGHGTADTILSTSEACVKSPGSLNCMHTILLLKLWKCLEVQ